MKLTLEGEKKRGKRMLPEDTENTNARALASKEVAGEKGWVTDLQDFVVHDGPGLRVTLFMRGCPLRCRWCQNPESLDLDPQIEYHQSRCIGCHKCAEVCPVPGAIVDDNVNRIDRSKCTKCMACVDSCLGRALLKSGEEISVSQAVERIVRYKAFFEHSDRGGVTLSGGEPAFQPDFSLKLLKTCRESGIHTVVQTCGYVNYRTLRELVNYVDLLIYDVKHMDDRKHKEGTGKSNRRILSNLRKLCGENGTEIVVHVPLIPEFNDDEENIRKTGEFVRSLKKIKHIDLLPFNVLASEKYVSMGIDWEYAKVEQQTPESLDRLRKILESHGFEVTLGGLW